MDDDDIIPPPAPAPPAQYKFPDEPVGDELELTPGPRQVRLSRRAKPLDPSSDYIPDDYIPPDPEELAAEPVELKPGQSASDQSIEWQAWHRDQQRRVEEERELSRRRRAVEFFRLYGYWHPGGWRPGSQEG